MCNKVRAPILSLMKKEKDGWKMLKWMKKMEGSLCQIMGALLAFSCFFNPIDLALVIVMGATLLTPLAKFNWGGIEGGECLTFFLMDKHEKKMGNRIMHKVTLSLGPPFHPVSFNFSLPWFRLLQCLFVVHCCDGLGFPWCYFTFVLGASWCSISICDLGISRT